MMKFQLLQQSLTMDISHKCNPRKKRAIAVVMFDDRYKNVTREVVYTARTFNDELVIDKAFEYISDSSVELHGFPSTEGSLELKTVGSRVVSTRVEVTVNKCPPGLIIDSINNQTSCTCKGDYGGLIECIGEKFQVKLQRGGWMGVYNFSNKPEELVAGQCPYCSLISNKQYFYLPVNVASLEQELCGKINRTGVLCGHCIDGYGPAANSESFQCLECTNEEAKYGWVFYLLTELLPTTVFFLVLAIFNISITYGSANAFVFFAQVITTTFKIDGDGVIPLENIATVIPILQYFYTVPYDTWNLNFFRSVLPPYCLSARTCITTLHLLLLGYIVALYPLLLILLCYLFIVLYNKGNRPVVFLFRPVHSCLARLRRVWNLHRTILHAFSSFILLSYTKFTLVSLILLTPTPLLQNDGSSIGSSPGVLYYDGDIAYGSIEHLPYLIAAVFVLVTFVSLPPVILFYPSIIACLQRHTTWKFLDRIQPGLKLNHFLAIFQGCYKDGTEEGGMKYDYRWFSGLYFVLRVFLFLVYAFTPDWFMQYVVQQFVCMGAVLLFVFLRPYRRDIYNNIDASVFTVLAGINTLSMYNYYFTALNISLSGWVFAFQYVLIFYPLIFISFYFAFKFLPSICIFLKLVLCYFKKDKAVATAEDDDTDQELDAAYVQCDSDSVDFLNFTEQTGRLESCNTYKKPEK